MATAKAQLTKATKKLLIRWEEATDHWDDSVSESIEKKQLEPLRSSVRAAISAMDTMGEVLARAEQDCS